MNNTYLVKKINMKKILISLVLILITNFSFAQKIEYKIYPVDETKNDTTISQFVILLKEVISAKDTFRLYQMLDKNIISSFGGGIYGKQGFIETWHQKNPEYDFDPYTTIICVKENIPIYKNPNKKSAIVGHLSYEVLTMDYEKTNNKKIIRSNKNWKWIYITTIDQSISGWILNNDAIYFLGGLSLIIEKVNNEYKITGFYPFD